MIFAPFLPFSSEKLHSFSDYETPLFGEQYSEEVSASLDSHKVLRYRDVSRIGKPTHWKHSELKLGAKLN